MIKFFRKIRQKLLSKSKFSQYLIYAIGEIVLVVIGILIALQINNWNAEQKTEKEEIGILNNLLESLTAYKNIANKCLIERFMFICKDHQIEYYALTKCPFLAFKI